MSSTKEQTVPAVPRVLGGLLDERVNSGIEALLARCDKLRRGSEIDRPTRFKHAGEAHPRSISAREGAGDQCDAPEEADR